MPASTKQFYRFRFATTLRQYSNISKEPQFLDRYKSKLERKAKEVGVSSVEELKDKFKDDIQRRKAELDQADPLRAIDPESGSVSKTNVGSNIIKSAEERKLKAEAQTNLKKNSPLNDIKSLDQFVDVTKLAQHQDPKEIEMIWKARFVGKEDAICGALTALTFSMIYRNARLFPTFVLPLPHENQGVELHYVQWSFAGPKTLHCMITSLAEYKLHQDFAKPHTTLIFHSDLMVDKGLVLMNGTVESDSAVSHSEGVLLSLNLQRFYSSNDGAKLQLLKAFNQGSQNFSVDQLIEEAQKL